MDNRTRMTRIAALLLMAAWLAWPAVGSADDTEIYGSSNAEIKPNVLIIFDNSGSMNDTIHTAHYDPATDYSSYGSYAKNSVYHLVTHRRSPDTWDLFIASVTSVTCTVAHDALLTAGLYNGKVLATGACGGRRDPNEQLELGNYLNYLRSPDAVDRKKIDIAHEVVTDLVNNTDGVNFGLMVFGSTMDSRTEGGHIVKEIKDMNVGTNRADLVAAIQALTPTTATPLAETLYEAGLYFKGASSYFNSGVTYTTPIAYSCQKNYIIIMTDGDPTSDLNTILSTAVGDTDGDHNDPGSYSSSGSDWLDDVAKKWYDEDLLASAHASGSGKQNIITYTIGFDVNNQLLQDTADNGRGQYFQASNAQTLSDAFSTVIGTILQEDTSFVAPVVPVSPENRTYSGDYTYIGFFRPDVDAFWSGNLKKYRIHNGAIVDKDGNPATNADGSFIETSVSYWSTSADGGRVQEGGVGSALQSMTLSPDNFDPSASGVRKLYTYTGTSADLKNASNQFEIANTAITPALLGLGAADTTGKDKLIKFIHGQDAYNGSTATRNWILGDILHSRPAIVNYSTSRSVIYVGANDGMLHAFDDSDGRELWGYIPSDQLAYLNNLTGLNHPYYVDGSPVAYIHDANNDGILGNDAGDKVILIFGERRGGTAYHALDVTDPDNPKFYWDLDQTKTGFSELGQTWSTPVLAQVSVGGSTKDVFFIGGGYDYTAEDALPAGTDTAGRAVYVVQVTSPVSGVPVKIWGASYDAVNWPSLTAAIPSDIAALDTDRNGFVDRFYVGDVKGRMLRFNVGDSSTANWTGQVLFQAPSGHKILYKPSVTREGAFYRVMFGTGDREHPLETTVVDRIYTVKDRDTRTTSMGALSGSDLTAALDEDDLVDVTLDLLQNPTATTAEVNAILDDLDAKEGWFIQLNAQDHGGEKVLAPTVILNGELNITTFQPTSTNVSVDPCLADVGVARLYVVNYSKGTAVHNYDKSNDGSYSSATNHYAMGGDGEVLSRNSTGTQDDRIRTNSSGSQELGSGIPSEVVVILPMDGQATGLVGVGGGMGITDVTNPAGGLRIYWKQLFN